MEKLYGSKFTITLPTDLVIKLELEKESLGIKSRVKMIEKCVRFYLEHKEQEIDLKNEIEKMKREIEEIKEKI